MDEQLSTSEPSITVSPKGTTSLVLGIIGLVFWLLPLLGLPVTIAGLLMGIRGLHTTTHARARAGIVLCIIGLVLSIINASIGAYLGGTGQHPLVNEILHR